MIVNCLCAFYVHSESVSYRLILIATLIKQILFPYCLAKKSNANLPKRKLNKVQNFIHAQIRVAILKLLHQHNQAIQ